MSNEISLRFLGHSAWQVRHGEHTLLIDPFITGNPLAAVGVDDLHPTHVILTHGHGDHLGDTVEIAKRSGAQVICGFEVSEYLETKGVTNSWGMSVGGSRTFEFGRLKFTIAHHGTGGPDGYCMGAAMGVLLMIDGRTIYHAGDTALFMDMKLIGELHPIDLALLPIGDNFTMGVDDAVHAVRFLNPAVTIPMHYDTFPPIEADAEEFRRRLEENGFTGHILEPGETYTLRSEG